MSHFVFDINFLGYLFLTRFYMHYNERNVRFFIGKHASFYFAADTLLVFHFEK